MLPALDRPATLARLRAQLDAPRVHSGLLSGGRLSAELPGIDAWLGGWPTPGVTEIVGAPGAGRLAPILPAFAALTRQGRPVVVVDPCMHVHPPGLGLDLSQVVLLRPPGDQAGWTTEQVARSGAVAALLVVDPPRLGRAGLRIARACEAGNVAVFVVAEEPEADLPAALRLAALGWEPGAVRLRCLKSRDGRAVGERSIPLEEPPRTKVIRLFAAPAA